VDDFLRRYAKGAAEIEVTREVLGWNGSGEELNVQFIFRKRPGINEKIA
jgi:hypothetical protein